MEKELKRALIILSLACIPLLLEMQGEISSIVDFRVIFPLIFYNLFAFEAKHGSKIKGTQSLYALLCKVSLLMAVSYTWISFFSNISKSLVPCIMIQAEGIPDGDLVECKRYGLVTKCLESVKMIYRSKRLSNHCPTSVLGSTLGVAYIVVNVFFRFVSIGIYGMWRLYVWDHNVRVAEKEDEVIIHKTYSTPSNFILWLCSVIILCCTSVMIGLQNIMPLLDITTVLPFFGIIVLYTSLYKNQL